MNTEVSFPLAKLLKEKGFDEKVNSYFADNGREEHFQPKYKMNYNSYLKVGLTHSRPTIAEVIDWIYEKHGVWIYSYHNGTLFIGSIQDSTGSIKGRLLGYKTPTEAYSAAIEYVLTNLI